MIFASSLFSTVQPYHSSHFCERILTSGKKGENSIIGIVLAGLTILGWIFVHFTEIKDLLLWRATFKKVTQVRKYFKMSRKAVRMAFYCSEFLGSLVESGYDCYFDLKKATKVRISEQEKLLNSTAQLRLLNTRKTSFLL